MYCRLGCRQAESCKHWRTFRELRSSENLWPLLCLSWNLIAKIVNPPISHGIRMLRMFCFMTKHTLLGLGCVFLLWTHASGRFGTFCVPKCCTIRNLPRKSESCNKIRRFLPWSRCSQLPELIGRFVPATFAVKRSGDSIDSGYSCESELVLHCFAERSQIQIRVFICQVSENPM